MITVTPETAVVMLLTGLVGLCVYKLITLIRGSREETEASFNREMAQIRQRLLNEQEQENARAVLAVQEAELAALRKERDRVILKALSKAAEEKRKKDDELTEKLKALTQTDPIATAHQLTADEHKAFNDAIAQELEKYAEVSSVTRTEEKRMTFREKLAQEHPELIGDQYLGGCASCPHKYGYEDGEDSPCHNHTRDGGVGSCKQCWDREMPEAQKCGGYITLDTDKLEPPTQTLEDLLTPGKLSKTDDPVNHPSHYTAGGIECIDAITSALTCHKDPIQAWLTGQVLRYMWRWPLKNGKQDLEKAKWYLDRLIGKVDGKK